MIHQPTGSNLESFRYGARACMGALSIDVGSWRLSAQLADWLLRWVVIDVAGNCVWPRSHAMGHAPTSPFP